MPITENTGNLTKELMPGMPLDTRAHMERISTIFSADNVQANIGGIPFGRGVVAAALPAGMEDPLAQYAGQLPVAGGRFLGIAEYTFGVQDWLNGNPDDYDHPRGFTPNKVVPVITKGGVGVKVMTAVEPGDPVFVHVSTDLDNGAFRADAGTGGIEVPGAAWRGYGEAGDYVGLSIDLTV